MFTGLVVGGIILIAALIAFSYWCVYRAGREKGYDEARADSAQQQLAERKAGRHAKGQPPTSPVRQETASIPSFPAGRSQPSRWYVPPPGPIRSHTSAARIAPVILPEPGTYLPQPARDSHPGTATLPRYGSVAYALDAAGVRPRLSLPATTGEMQAITDEWIERMQAEEAADRAARKALMA